MILIHFQKRQVLENTNQLEPRVRKHNSPLYIADKQKFCLGRI